MRDKTIVGAPEAKPGGMKPSVSAPSSLPGVIGSQKSSLFDDDNDDLFGAVKETRCSQFHQAVIVQHLCNTVQL